MAENEVNVNTSNAYPKDGEVVITVLPNYSAAFMSIYPAVNGGRDITYDAAMAELAAKSVRHNIRTDLIKNAIDNKDFDTELKVSEADMPENGIDGTITYKFNKTNELAPKEDENGFVDYKDLGFIQNIREGTVIAEITMPTQGTDGTDVRGVTMRAIPGKKASFNLGPGTSLSEDGTQITAACDGHIYFKNGAFNVDSTVTVGGNVDASIGNIDFIGDVVIKGEVMEGFSVVSQKSITVAGNVTKANLKAKENIVIKKGSINSALTAGGNIVCQFSEYSALSAEGDIQGQDFVVCDVHCGGNLTAKALNGGSYTILGDTEVKYLGTKTYAPTEIVAGNNALLAREKDTIESRMKELDVTIERCTQIVDFLNEKRKQLGRLPEDKEELLGTTVKTKLTCQMEKKQGKKRLAEIEEILAETQHRSIICKGTVYPGVKVTINSAVTKIDKETTRVKIFQDDSGNIVMGTP